MGSRKKSRSAAARPARARSTRGRQRQRLIDACISALHIYGPSRTTVEKVVAIAKMSPGIVRFYFDSKAAMLVASLQFLAAEFEEQVLVPVANLKLAAGRGARVAWWTFISTRTSPAPAKSPFGMHFGAKPVHGRNTTTFADKKDESFAALVRELIGRLIEETRAAASGSGRHCARADRRAGNVVAGFRLPNRGEHRPAGREAPLHGVSAIDFPRAIPAAPVRPASGRGAAQAQQFAGWVYGNARAFALERERMFRGAWQFVGHESQVPRPGDFLAVDSARNARCVVRDSSGRMHALRNSCPAFAACAGCWRRRPVRPGHRMPDSWPCVPLGRPARGWR